MEEEEEESGAANDQGPSLSSTTYGDRMGDFQPTSSRQTEKVSLCTFQQNKMDARRRKASHFTMFPLPLTRRPP